MGSKVTTANNASTSGRRKPVLAAAIALLVIAFLMGGSSRPDVASLLVFRPLSVLFLGIAIYHLRWDDLERFRFPLLMLGACYALVLLHLIPLPPFIWQNLGGRELVTEISAVAGQSDIWRPLSLVPKATRNAFWALIPTTAFLLLLVQLRRNDLEKFVPVLAVLGLASAVLGLLQLLGDPQGPLYFYASTNNGAAVGFFANRNHQAVFLACIIPALFILGQSRQSRSTKKWVPDASGIVGLGGVIVIVSMLMISGSRAGLAVGAIALLAGPFLSSTWKASPAKGQVASGVHGWLAQNSRFAFVGFAVLAMIGAIVMGQDQSLDRLSNTFSMEEMRVRILPTMWEMIRLYAPFGSGIGSFQWVYQVNEPDILLSPGYMNRAHNEWLDIPLTSGIPGLILAIVAIAGFFRHGWQAVTNAQASEQSLRLSRAGAVILIIIAGSSITDYHTRVPSVALVSVLALVWLYLARDAQPGNAGKESLHR